MNTKMLQLHLCSVLFASTLMMVRTETMAEQDAEFQLPACTIHIIAEDPWDDEDSVDEGIEVDDEGRRRQDNPHSAGRQYATCTGDNVDIEFQNHIQDFYAQEIWDGDIVQMDTQGIARAAGLSDEEFESLDPDMMSNYVRGSSVKNMKAIGKESDGKGSKGKGHKGGDEDTSDSGKGKKARRTVRASRSVLAEDFQAALMSGDRITLNAIPPMVKLSDARALSRARRSTKRQFAEAVAEHGPRSVLLVRVHYQSSDGELFLPSHCDEACLRKNMWYGSDNVNALFKEISSGLVEFPPSQGRIINITVRNGQHARSPCKFWEIGLEADVAIRAQLKFEPGDYDHRAYILPQKLGGCTFGGLGYVGCSPLYCKTWIRQPAGGTLGHELGHNLGVWHSSMDYTNDGVQENEYGDNSDLMGSTTNWRGFNAPHRVVMNWIPNEIDHIRSFQDWMIQCEHPAQMKLFSISRQLEGTNKVILKVPRKSPGGGNYFISYRTSSGYDTGLSSVWKNKVYVHYHTTHSTRFQTNTQLVERLEGGNSFSDPNSPVTINVISTHTDYALISYQFCRAGEIPIQPTPPPTPPPPTTTAELVCEDSNIDKCRVWKEDGYCLPGGMYYPYMKANCMKACGICGEPEPKKSKDGFDVFASADFAESRVAECQSLIDGHPKPTCGISSPINAQCCDDKGLKCIAIKKKNSDATVHKCVVVSRRGTAKLPIGGTCTKSLQCESKNCDKMGTWKCLAKQNRQRRSGKLVQRARNAEEEDEVDEEETGPNYEPILHHNKGQIFTAGSVLLASAIVVVAGFSFLAVRVKTAKSTNHVEDPSTDLCEVAMNEESDMIKSEMVLSASVAKKYIVAAPQASLTSPTVYELKSLERQPSNH
eukprot:m.31653 g.31653  ORF g.31653 m.31653 type:complete len:878 (+) comp16498_c0_seq1:353-2986(+)